MKWSWAPTLIPTGCTTISSSIPSLLLIERSTMNAKQKTSGCGIPPTLSAESTIYPWLKTPRNTNRVKVFTKQKSEESWYATRFIVLISTKPLNVQWRWRNSTTTWDEKAIGLKEKLIPVRWSCHIIHASHALKHSEKPTLCCKFRIRFTDKEGRKFGKKAENPFYSLYPHQRNYRLKTYWGLVRSFENSATFICFSATN